MAVVTIEDLDHPGIALIFPITPKELPDTGEAVTKTFNVIGAGSFSFPQGRKEQTFTVSGYFPGVLRFDTDVVNGSLQNPPHIHDFRPPSELMDQIKGWLQFKTRLSYAADTRAGGNKVLVYLSKYSFTRRGYAGDVDYQLSFTEWRTLQITIDDGSPSSNPMDPGAGSGQDADQSAQPEDEPVPTDYTVQEGDNLSYIAKQYLGDTSRWTEIYDANKDTIGDNPNLIYPGQVLHIPGGTEADPDQDGFSPSGSDATTGPTWEPGTPVT